MSLMYAQYTPMGGFRREVQPRRQHWFLNEKVGFPRPHPRLLLGFQGTKSARREGISSPFNNAGGCTSPQNSGRTYFVHFFEPSDRLEAKKSRKISLCAIVCKNSRGFRTASLLPAHSPS